MTYEVKGTLLGFQDTAHVELHMIDDLFSTMIDANNKDISFTLANPYSLREYSFDVPTSIKVLLEMDDKSSLSVYNIVVIQEPLENSTVNFLAPIIVNNDNKRVAQAVLDSKRHPDFGMAESIKSFKEFE